MMNKLVIPALLISLCVSPASWSKGNYQSGHHAKKDWAKVTRVKDITRTVEHNSPSEVCWTEQVRREHYSRRHSYPQNDGYSGAVLGGIIGGALGNAVGHRKKNKQFGTAIGAVLGATVGHDISTRNRHRPDKRITYQDERRCEIRDHITYEEEVVGYHVWYRYMGNEYKTRMKHHPGKKIKVRVKVEPY